MDVLCELYPIEMTAILASKRIFAGAATGGARIAELPNYGIYKAYYFDNENPLKNMVTTNFPSNTIEQI